MDSEATIIESETRYTLNIPCKCNGRRRLTGVSGTFISVHSENNDRFKVSEHVCCFKFDFSRFCVDQHFIFPYKVLDYQ